MSEAVFVLPRVVALSMACLLSSCASTSTEDTETSATEQPDDAPPAGSVESPVPAPPAAAVVAREEIVERGSGSFLNDVARRDVIDSGSGEINLRFDGVDLNEFINVVLGDLLQVNYSVDPNVTGTVTIHTINPITEAQLLPLFEELLAVNSAALVRSAGLYRIVTRDVAERADQPLTIANGVAGPGFTTQVISLEYISALEMQGILEKVLANPSTIRIDSARNIIIASGTAAELQVILETIDIFDVDWLRGMSVGLYPLDNVQPGTLEAELIDVLNAATGGATQEALGGIVRLVPLERLSSLLVVSSTPAALREIEIWIRRLDQPGESAGRRLYVYPMQNAKASELADILGSVFESRSRQSTGGATAAILGSTVSPGAELAPGLTPMQIGGALASALEESSTQGAPPLSGVGAATGVELTGNEQIEIIADDVRNALVILASPQDYRMVEAAIQRLDVIPLQVLIEARILEVTLRDDLSFGVEWFFENSINGDESTGIGTSDTGSAGITALAPAFSYTVVSNADQVRLALNTLASESEVNVLSSPSLMVLDNQTATISVGDEIPVPTRQAISNLDPVSPTVNEITFRQTGVTLSVTPRVNNSGLVTMDILQEVATAAPTTTSNIDAPTIQNRQIESVVAVNSGDTIVLGGLMQDQQSNGRSGIPGLYRIPVLGRLFGRKVDEYARTELLVLITPRVVRNQDDARRVTEEFRRKLPQLRALGNSGENGESAR